MTKRNKPFLLIVIILITFSQIISISISQNNSSQININNSTIDTSIITNQNLIDFMPVRKEK